MPLAFVVQSCILYRTRTERGRHRSDARDERRCGIILMMTGSPLGRGCLLGLSFSISPLLFFFFRHRCNLFVIGLCTYFTPINLSGVDKLPIYARESLQFSFAHTFVAAVSPSLSHRVFINYLLTELVNWISWLYFLRVSFVKLHFGSH